MITSRAMRRLAAPALLLLALAAAAPAAAAPSRDCGPPPDGALCAEGPWLEFARMAVTLRQGTVTSRFEVTIADGRDVLASTDETTPYYRGKADAILIGGTVLGTRKDAALPGEGMQLLDDPVLAAKEAATLLQIARPKGPRSVGARTTVKASGKRILQVKTPTIESLFGPPWTIEGWVAPAGPGAWTFDLALSFRLLAGDGSLTERTHTHRYEGRVEFPAKRPRLPDAFVIDGWTLEGPSGAPFGLSTLGEARKALGIAPAR